MKRKVPKYKRKSGELNHEGCTVTPIVDPTNSTFENAALDFHRHFETRWSQKIALGCIHAREGPNPIFQNGNQKFLCSLWIFTIGRQLGDFLGCETLFNVTEGLSCNPPYDGNLFFGRWGSLDRNKWSRR